MHRCDRCQWVSHHTIIGHRRLDMYTENGNSANEATELIMLIDIGIDDASTYTGRPPMTMGVFSIIQVEVVVNENVSTIAVTAALDYLS